jgi:hypothetical protein
MTRTLLALTFTLALASASAGAATWPWQEPVSQEPPEYCKGLVISGLASKQVSGTSRTELWLAWNYVIRSGALDQTVAASEYQQGRAQFDQVADAAAAEAVLQQSDGDCGLGRSGHQITGW